MSFESPDGTLMCARCRREAPLEEAAGWDIIDAESGLPVCPSCVTDDDTATIAAWEADECEQSEAFRDAEARRTEHLTDDELSAEFGDRE